MTSCSVKGGGRSASRKRVAGSSTSSTAETKITLIADEWLSKKGGLSTLNRELAIQLAKFSYIAVRLFMAECSEEEKKLARQYNIEVIEADQGSGKNADKWWTLLPPNFATDFIIGHSFILGKQAEDIRKNFPCKWVQVVHTDPEELGSYKSYSGANATGEKKFKKEVELCKKADLVVGVGPKLAEVYRAKLRRYKKEVFALTPSFHEFSKEEQAEDEGKKFRVLIFGRGDTEDISLKGFDLAAQAVAELPDESYHLIFVGVREGEHEKVKERLLEEGHGGLADHQLKVREYITCRDDLDEVLFESDLAIMPSRSEGFGLTALEALSAGLPILVGKNTGFAEAMKEVFGGESCIVDSYEAKDWADRIKRVQKMPRKKRLDHARRLCEAFIKEYSWEDQCRSLVERMLALNDDLEGDKEDLDTGNPSPCKRHKVGSDEVNEDDSDGCASGDTKSSDDDDDDDDDDDSEVEVKDDGSHGNNRKEKEEKELGVLSKPKKKPQFSGASESAATPPEEAPQIVFKEGEPSDVDLNRLAGKIASKWETVGLYLNIEQEVLEEISVNAKDKPYEMLLHWKKNIRPSSKPYRELYNALCESRVGLSKLARDFCFKTGTPSNDELEKLANDIHTDSDTWKKVAGRLGITRPNIIAIDDRHKGLSEKAYHMLLQWKQSNGSQATYQVLFEALTNELVSCRTLAETYCCEN